MRFRHRWSQAESRRSATGRLAVGQLVNRQTGKCLDVSDGGTTDQTPIIQWSCNGGDD